MLCVVVITAKTAVSEPPPTQSERAKGVAVCYLSCGEIIRSQQSKQVRR